MVTISHALEVIRRGLIVPGMPFLAKPFTIDDVLSKVREALGTRPLDDAGVIVHRALSVGV